MAEGLYVEAYIFDIYEGTSIFELFEQSQLQRPSACCIFSTSSRLAVHQVRHVRDSRAALWGFIALSPLTGLTWKAGVAFRPWNARLQGWVARHSGDWGTLCWALVKEFNTNQRVCFVVVLEGLDVPTETFLISPGEAINKSFY